MHSLCRTTEKKTYCCRQFQYTAKKRGILHVTLSYMRERDAHTDNKLCFNEKLEKEEQTSAYFTQSTMVTTVQHIHWWRWINAPNTPFRGQPISENIVGKHEATHHSHIAHCSETVWQKSVTGSASRYQCNLANKCADIFSFGNAERKKERKNCLLNKWLIWQKD